LAACFFAIGFFSKDIYNAYSSQRFYDGIRFEANNSQTAAIQTAQNMDYYGDWVCINIKGMDYRRAVEVCNHETGHEIFAEECENNMSKCLEAVGK
jgi:hypothetical protein